MDHVIVDRIPDLTHPVMVAAFQGWNDAGEAASGAVEFLIDSWDAPPFARLDPEEFYDFQVHRPTVRLEDGATRRTEWPSNAFHHASPDGRDLVLLLGVEPNVRWRTFATAIVDLARRLGTERLITLGAFLADVAHTRPVPVVGYAADREEAEALGLATSRYEGPTGITGVLGTVARAAGLPAVAFWGAAPHYVPAGVNPKATLAMVKSLTRFLEIDVGAGRLPDAASAWERRVSELVSENEGLAEYVQRLESAQGAGFTPDGEGSGEALAEEIERYLRDRSGGGEPS